MEPVSPKQSPDTSDAKPSFRKPTNDSTGRRYRRHSPVRGADSSSSDDSSKHHSRIFSREDHAKDDRLRRNDGKESDREPHSRYGRFSNSYTNSDRADRHNYGSSHEHRRDLHGREHRDVDGDDRVHQKPSRSGREPKNGDRSGYHIRQDIKSDRSRDRSDYDLRISNARTGDWDRRGDRGARDDRRAHHRSPGKYKNDNAYPYEGQKEHTKDFDTDRTRNKEDRQDDKLNMRKRNKEHLDGKKYNREFDDEIKNKRGLSSNQDRDDADKIIDVTEDQNISTKKHKFESADVEKTFSKAKAVEDEKPDTSSEQAKKTISKFSSEPPSYAGNQAEAGLDITAAKVAAMKAAELVNKNIAGAGPGGFLSTDQKKKLLWGNKKNASTEESGSRWDLPLFSDRERQEKFNKLMSLRLPWYLWPLVGCERRVKDGAKTRGEGRPSSREAGTARDGFGEAVHSWTSKKRWPNSWSRSVRIITLKLLSNEDFEDELFAYFIC